MATSRSAVKFSSHLNHVLRSKILRSIHTTGPMMTKSYSFNSAEQENELERLQVRIEKDLRETRWKIDVPGVGKKELSLRIEKDRLICHGVEAEKYNPRNYRVGIRLPEGKFKEDKLKAEIKNGILRAMLPMN